MASWTPCTSHSDSECDSEIGETDPDFLETTPLAPTSYDGLVLSLVSVEEWVYVERHGLMSTMCQFGFAAVLHIGSVLLQLGLVFYLLVTTIQTQADAFREGIDEKIVAIDTALRTQPQVPLAHYGETAVAALELCKTDGTLAKSHLLILLLWSVKMMQEMNDASWRLLLILGLPAADDGDQLLWEESKEAHEGKDTKKRILIKRATTPIKVATCILVCAPQFICAAFLWWTGAKFLFFTSSMGTLIMKAISLSFILQLDELMFAAFASFRFKRRLKSASYEHLQGTPTAFSVYGVGMLKFAAVVSSSLFFYQVVFHRVTRFRHLCDEYFEVFPYEWSEDGVESLWFLRGLELT